MGRARSSNRTSIVQTPPALPDTKGPLSSSRLDFDSVRDAHIYLLIILVACVIYAKSIAYQYTYFDDVPLVVLNQSVLNNLSNIPRLFSTDVFISFNNPELFYRPLLDLLIMLELQISKNSPAIFHITNILMHIGSSLLLFVVFKRLKLPRMLAAAAALIFCVHPLNTSAVVWIPGSNDLLLTLLILASFSLFLQALDTNRLWFWALHLFLFFLALLTKESAIVFPLLCAVYALWVRRDPLTLRTKVLVAAGYLISIAVWYVLRSSVPHPSGFRPTFTAMASGWIENSPGFILYVGKILLPLNLSVMPNLRDQSLVLGIISLALFVVAFVVHPPSSLRKFSWGIGWFIFFLAPTFLSATILHEHRTYSAFFGILFAAAQLPVIQSIDFSKSSRVLGLVALLAFYGVVAMMHSEHFRNRTTYAMDAFLKDPGVGASHAALADLFLSEGDDKQAEQVLTAAIAQDSSMRFVHRLLGDLYANRHEFGRATRQYEASIRIDKYELYSYIGYGKVCIGEGQPDKALELWKQTVVVSPNFLIGYQYLASFYTFVRNDPDSAMFYVRKVQQRGGTVVQPLLDAIEENAKLKRQKK